MKKVELHAKSKFGLDYDSVIDIEALLWNVKENGEKGVVIVDKDSIVAFPKIEKIYHKLCLDDSSFKKIKVGYGVQLTTIIEDSEQEIVVLVKKQHGLKNLYKIMSLYNNDFKKIPIENLLKYKDGLLIGLILNNTNRNLDLSLFDYVEICENIDISDINKIIVFSNHPNSFFPGDIKALEVLYFRKEIERKPKSRLYLDTDDTLLLCNDTKLVVTNTNLIFDKLERIIINDEKFHITHTDNYDEFASLVKVKFQKKYKNSSLKIKERLDRELNLIKELDYAYYFKTLMDITYYCKAHHQYYQLDGYINNSLVAFTLEITEIEPVHLPYELFFSKIPNIVLRVSPKFYKEELSAFVYQKFKDLLLGHSYRYKLSNVTTLSTIKRYEKSIGKVLKLSEKDYICTLLNQVTLSKSSLHHSYFIIPEHTKIEDFTPYWKYEENDILYTHFEYSDLINNFIQINFILDKDIDFISRLRNITKTNIQFCNDQKVFNLFRNTEEFNTTFNILDRTSGLLNIKFFDTEAIERKLKLIPNLWLNNLIDVLTKLENLNIIDDLYLTLSKTNLDDFAIFNVINYLNQSVKSITSKATLINKIRISYMQMYYKLYFPKFYYKEILANYDYKYIDVKMFSYDIKKLKERYLELRECDRLWMQVGEHQELGLLEIIFEMYERKINFKLETGKVVVE